MTQHDQIKLMRVKNIINLSFSSQSQNKNGWTLVQLSEWCEEPVARLRPFISQLIGMGYINQTNKLFMYSKKINPSNVDTISDMIVRNWGRNIYKSSSIEKLKDFTTFELETELLRRKKLLKNGKKS